MSTTSSKINHAKEIILNALRGIAAMTVVLSHSDQNELIYVHQDNIKGMLGLIGVNLFFILSGYLIWTSAKNVLPRPSGLGVYAIHRFTRIAPLYYISFFLALYVIPAIGSVFEITPGDSVIWRHLTFTQGLLPAVDRAVNPVLWTITHEVTFYTLIPFIYLLLKRVRVEILLGVSLLLTFPALANLFGPFAPFAKKFYLFVIGIMLVERVNGDMPLWIVPLAIIAACAAPFLEVELDFGMSIISAAVFVSALAVPSNPDNKAGTALVKILKPAAMVGVVSYSLYIWHYLFLNVFSYHIHTILAFVRGNGMGILWENVLLRGICVFGLMLLVSTISYLLFEKPSMVHLRRFLVAKLTAKKS